MSKLSRTHLTAAAVGGTTIADAADRSTSTATTAQRSGGGAGETPLTGTTKDKVQAAALAKVAGSVLRVETDNGGAYEAHIRKSDGTEVEVKVSKDFGVTAVEDAPAGGRSGHGGPGGGMH